VKLDLKYQGASAIINEPAKAHVAFATNTLREASYFNGELGKPLVFREALAALHAVVVQDLKFRPRDRLAFQAWMAEQDRKFLASLAVKSQQAMVKLRELEARLDQLDKARLVAQRPFHTARDKYFQYVWTHQYELSYLLDPVITVHPDELSFEAFSRDESSYARLAVRYDVFKRIDGFECGTTNIDYSAKLADQLQRMRSYRETNFAVGPSGFAVQVGDAPVHKEKKIDLPDSWVMGFLQVHSVMTMGLTRLRLQAIDLYNILRQLRRRKARVSPRALRWELVPGQRVRVVLEPWEQVIELTTVYDGPKHVSIRTWGRDRLQTLARLIPVAQKIEVCLAGFGMPTIWLLDLGHVTFTLALSGWTDNDWAGGGGGGKFDLLLRKRSVTEQDLDRTFQALRTRRVATDGVIAIETGLQPDVVRSACSYLCQVGRAMYDLGGGVFRHRELFLEPFTPKGVIAAAEKAAVKASPEAAKAQSMMAAKDVMIIARRPTASGYKISGSAASSTGRVRPQIELDWEGALVTATCTCSSFASKKLTQGPCEHILALRLAHMARLDEEQKKKGG
jgi:hypothetical protein